MRSTPVRYSDDSAGFDAPAKPIGTPAGLGRRVGPLALDHPLALLGIDALAGIGLQYRRVGLLICKKNGWSAIDVISATAHKVPTLPMPTTLIAASTRR
jgi:hypothetical protein